MTVFFVGIALFTAFIVGCVIGSITPDKLKHRASYWEAECRYARGLLKQADAELFFATGKKRSPKPPDPESAAEAYRNDFGDETA